MINQMDYVNLGLVCAKVCITLNWVLREKGMDNLNEVVFEAIRQLALWVIPAVHVPGSFFTVF